MGILKLPDVNFTASGYYLASASQGYTGPDTTIGGVTPSGTLFSMVSGITGTSFLEGLFIYKGTPPTQAELDAFESSTTAVTATSSFFRNTDLLAYLKPKTSVFSKNSAVITFGPTLGLLSGTASWFLFGASWYAAAYPSMYMSGTIGAIGSGADLEVYTTSLVAGSYYKLPMFTVSFPNSLSF